MGQDPHLSELVDATRGLQLGRRLVHLACGVGFLILVEAVPLSRSQSLLLLSPIFLAALAMDWARLRSPDLNRLFFGVFRHLASPREEHGVASASWYVLGVLLAFLVFPVGVAVLGVLVLALADPAASVVGRAWGKGSLGTGTLLGTLAFWTVAIAALAPFLGPGKAAVVASLTAAAEVLPLPVDDNVTIPLVAGAAVWGVSLFL